MKSKLPIQPIPPKDEPRICFCGAPENNHPYRHPFKPAPQGSVYEAGPLREEGKAELVSAGASIHWGSRCLNGGQYVPIDDVFRLLGYK